MKQCTALLMLVFPVLALGDYSPTQAHWPGWRIYTSEDLSWGAKYKGYPIGNMFDENPATAWVFKGVPLDPEETGYSRSRPWGGEHAISIKFGARLRLDGLQIMNGYNKSQEVFLRNNRVVEIQIYSGARPHRIATLLKTVILPDRMGWHSISLPPGDYEGLTLVFSKMAVGRDNDLTISGLRLMNAGIAVGPRTPPAYVVSEGSECGCGTEYAVIRADGAELARTTEMAEYYYSPDGRHVIGFRNSEQNSQAWIADMRTATIVARRNLSWSYEHEVGWESGSVVVWPAGHQNRAVRIRL